MKNRGIGAATVAVIIIVIIVAAAGGYIAMSGDGGGGTDGSQGLDIDDLRPSIGDEWKYKMTTNDNMVLEMDLKVENSEIVSFDNYSAEAYVATSEITFDNLGNILPAGATLSSKNGTFTMYIENDPTGSSKTIISFTISGSVGAESFTTSYDSTETTYVISGESPDTINVGDSWESTVKKIENKTTIVTVGGEPYQERTSYSESEETMNYEVLDTETVTVSAGTFDTYKVKNKISGSDNYTVNYYSSKAKQPVKSISYSNGETTQVMELISYDVE